MKAKASAQSHIKNDSEISYQSSNKKLYFHLSTGPHEIQNKAFLSNGASTACLYTDDFYVRQLRIMLEIGL